jgi:hypothetical protein
MGQVFPVLAGDLKSQNAADPTKNWVYLATCSQGEKMNGGVASLESPIVFRPIYWLAFTATEKKKIE